MFKKYNKIIIYGFGLSGKRVFELWSDKKMIMAICDSEKQQQTEYRGVPIIRPEQISEFDYEQIIVASIYSDDIKKVLEKHGVASSKVTVYEAPLIMIDKMIHDIDEMFRKYSGGHAGKKLNFILAKKLLKSSCDGLLKEEWRLLYIYFVLEADFLSAIKTRNKFQHLVLSNECQSFECIKEKVLCLLDMGKYEDADKCLRQFVSINNAAPKYELSFLRALCGIYRGFIDYEGFSINMKGKDRFFYEFVKGKTVAIVGPSCSNMMAGEEIDGFDLVVRMLPSLKDKSAKSYIGSRTDIVYVAAHKLNTMKKDEKLLQLDDVFYVFEGMTSDWSSGYDVSEKSRGIAFQKERALFNSIPNFLQRMLIDLLLMGVGRIKIFNFDFYTSRQFYKKSYLDFLDREKASSLCDDLLTNQAIYHDFASQFNFCKLLYQNGLIEPDKKAREILGLTLEHYYSCLQSSFGNYNVS